MQSTTKTHNVIDLATLPKTLGDELKATAERMQAYQNEHGNPITFTGRYALRRSYYSGRPRILISAVPKEESYLGWMLAEVYANGPSGLGQATFDALWDLAE